MTWNKVNRLEAKNIDAHKEQAIIHYDWLTAVMFIEATPVQFPSINDYIMRVLDELGFDKNLHPVENKQGINHYDKSATLFDGHVIIGYPADLDSATPESRDTSSTITIQISGRGLSSMGAMYENRGLDIDYFFNTVTAKNGWFSRIDVALDLFNYSDEYSPYNAYELTANGQLVSHSRRVRWMQEFSSKGMIQNDSKYSTSKEGTTFYIGRNPNQLRIYNKKAERASKVGLLFDVDSWYRWEFQVNGSHAEAFTEDIMKLGLEDAYRAWMRHHRFVKLDDSNRSRCSNLEWYNNLVNHIDYTKTSLAVKPTFQSSKNWLDNQVAPTLATIFMVKQRAYMRNGLSDEDARVLAWKDIKRDYVDTAIADERVDISRLEAYDAEHLKEVEVYDDFDDIADDE